MNKPHDDLTFAKLQGFYDMITEGPDMGWTHPDYPQWSEAYDQGRNEAEAFLKGSWPASPGVVTLDAREAANVLAALRVMQFDVEQGADFSGHMSLDGHDIMSGEEIDALCEHINVPARNDGLAVPTVGTGSIPEERMAVLSTGHVPFEESIHIGVLIDDGDIIGMCRDEGWLVHTTPLRESCRGLVPQLNYVLGYLRAKGFDWVLFDRDAGGTDELDAYDW